METYLYALLRNHKDTKALLEVAKSFGVALSIADHEPEHFINLGSIVHEDLELFRSDVPYGYEEDAITKYCLVKQLRLYFQGNDNIDKNALLTLKSIEIFPKNSDSVPKVEVNTLASEVPVLVGSSMKLELAIDFNTDFTGHLKRLLLLTVEITEKPEALVVRRTEFTMGVIIIGTVLPAGLDREVAIRNMNSEESNSNAAKHSKQQQLSVEAKPFTPIALVSAFDIQCHTISLATCPKPLINAFCPPPHFLLALMHPALAAEYTVPEVLTQEINYLSHLRANTLENVVKQMNLCLASDLVESHTLSAALSYQYSADILSNHVKLISLEEIQTKIDIAQYDMHYISLQTTRKDSPFQWNMQGGTCMMTAKLKIPGSSENRPKIQLGGDIYLRPVEEDLYKLASFGLNAVIFELRGVCIHYQLSTEEAIFEFPNICLNTVNMLDELFHALRFHVRFGYEHNGFCFIRWAVRNISQDRYLVECLFPTEDTVARLKAHAATQQSAVNTEPPGINIRKTNLEHFLRDGTLPTSSTARSPTAAAKSVQSLQTDESGVERSSLSPFSPCSAAVPDFNDQQLEAITAIVALAKDPRWAAIRHGYTDEAQQGHLPMPPFIIYGPPGTGKTSTVTEAILRVCRLHPTKRILACAPSDAAADVLCERLARYLSPQQLFRLNWWQRVSASMPAKLRPYTLDVNDIFELPRAEVLQVYQVIVCSCGTAGVLKALPSEQFRFDMVFVDEASQAIEAEVLVPLELCRHGGVMVLSGDTNQLGPSTRCPLFPLCTDGASLQERLLRLPFYSGCWPENAKRSKHLSLTSRAPQKQVGTGRWGYETAAWAAQMDSSRNTSAINLSALRSAPPHRSKQSIEELCLGVFLYKNYRSHRAILELPSRLFYADALEECADRSRTEFLSEWARMPRRPDGQAFPVMMIGVDGQHQHEIESPSFYNTAEIEKVVEICGDLVRTSSLPPGTVSAKDIGVIAAFRQQVLRLRIALRAAGLSNVNVGSVEDFQGQEVRVVVISTVLSEWADRFETQGAIGLMGDAKRFNVAITRGMALCVVVGQPRLLYSDPRWREMLKYTVANGGYSGMDIFDFLRQPRLNKAEEGSATDGVQAGYEGWNDEEEDERLLSSLADVANTLVAADSRAVMGDAAGLHSNSSVSAVVSRFDMEWRNIL